ncbi:3-dehydroquinate synthase family protein, partial [Vibrio parahaemolyticus V-223/04]
LRSSVMKPCLKMV